MKPFDPHSSDSMFTHWGVRLDYQDRLLREIHDEVKRTNGRVTVLECDRQSQRKLRKTLFAVTPVIFGLIGYGINAAIAYFKKS